MANDGSFSRSSTICFFLILMLSEVIGIRTGDHVFTRRNLLQLLNDQGLTKVSLLFIFFISFTNELSLFLFFFLPVSVVHLFQNGHQLLIIKMSFLKIKLVYYFFIFLMFKIYIFKLGIIVSFKFIFKKSEQYEKYTIFLTCCLFNFFRFLLIIFFIHCNIALTISF